MRFLIVAILLLAWPGTALADMRATWQSLSNGSQWTAEAADNGDGRLDPSGMAYYLLRSGGELHAVYTNAAAPRVVRIRDLQQVMRERGVGFRPPPGILEQGQFVARGDATIAGRRGRALYLRFEDGELSPRPMIVVSDDPAFAPLGRMFSDQMEFSITAIRIAGATPPENFLVARRFIGDGTPLLFAGYSLETIDAAPIDSKRFELPGAPMSLEDLRGQELRVLVPVRPGQ
ncbi:MAG TPA: hypothetical protein VF702_01090 [Allosphingosinicella sp.]